MLIIISFLFGMLTPFIAGETLSLFNGKDLTGWDGDPTFWSVKDGAITGTSTPKNPVKQNTFLIWKDGTLDNFELLLKYRIVRGNSGIQYRSKVHDPKKGVVGGYQADFEAGKSYSGILYEERGRGILATRGQKVIIDGGGGKTVVGSTGDSNAIQASIKKEDWNDYVITARGHYLLHRINGHTTVEVFDNQESKRAMSGILALQMHVGPPMVVQFKDIQLTKLSGVAAKPPEAAPTMGRWNTQKPEILNVDAKEEDQPPKKVAAAETKKPKKPKKMGGPVANWIWGHNPARSNEQFFLRKEFKGGSKSATLIASCDNHMKVFFNGKLAARSDQWKTPIKTDVQKFIQPGKNVILVEAKNDGGPAGFVLKLTLEMPKGRKRYIITDKTWQAAKKKDAEKWTAVHTFGKMGAGPWGSVFSGERAVVAMPAPKKKLTLLPGFQAELLYTVPKGSQGSWVSITFDNKGRLIASDQGKKGLYRVIPAPIGGGGETKVEKLNVNITSAQGLLYAFDSLYLSINGGPGSGLYRAKDVDGDDQFDKVEKLRPLRGGGEHGPHTIRLSPDGKSLYIICGNSTNLPKFDSSTIPTNWKEDLLLPRQWDARGHARGRLAPGGWICRTDPDGKKWEVFSMGYRNPYGMSFNADGELFAYDADMEWDLGTPWYRPTRVVHATSGSEFGWRSGPGKWPTYFQDSLPPVIDIGPGSPTGTTFGYGAKFPARYQKALYILDWTFGTIYAIHLSPNGASYTATKEEFVSGSPLPVTNAAIGPDGAFYFTIGGRGTQSALYRVTYIGKEPTGQVDAKDKKFAKDRALRHRLEAWHTKLDMKAIDAVWPYLGHPDRSIRYAARTGLEFQPPGQWKDRAIKEKDPQSLITAVTALARQGDKSLQPEMLEALGRLDFKSLTEVQKLELLRTYALTFIRMGRPGQETADKVAARFDKHYPAKSDNLNRELSRVLVYLESPSIIEKTIRLMQTKSEQSMEEINGLISRNAGYGRTIARMLANQPKLQKVHYAFVLRNLRYGWSLDQRKAYYQWLDSAKGASGGASYQGFINNIRKEAMVNTSKDELAALKLTKAKPAKLPKELPKPKGPGRKWTVDDLATLVQAGLRGRDFVNGKNMYAAAQCISCHRFDGYGGATGPDLAVLDSRFSFRDLSEAIIEPSKIISDQYQSTIIVTKDEDTIAGRIAGEEGGKLLVLANPLDANEVTKIAKSDIKAQKPSPVSQMPDALLNQLNSNEVLDLMAYLMSRGNPKDRMFKK